MVTKNTMDKWKFFYTVFLPTLISFTQNAESGVQVVLTADPPWSDVLAEETVRLTCKVMEWDPFTQWEYSWKKLREAEETTLSSSYTREGLSVYTLSNVTEPDSAQYWCEAKIGKHSAVSVTHTVNVHASVVLTLEPGWRTFYTTEQVTLSCEIHSILIDWGYLWYKDGQELSIDTAVGTYIIHSVDQSDSGTYSCRGKNRIKPMYTASSNTVMLMVSGSQFSGVSTRPQAALSLETAWTEIFRTDSLTLRCEVEGSSLEWNYTWYRDGQHLPLHPSRDRLTLTSGNNTYRSQYRCRGNRTGEPSYTEISEGYVPAHKVSRVVENLARVGVGVAILLFLSVILNEAFWKKVRR